ncbi:uncharacterized protein LOC125649620 [Ostrea edulis]|uniref:uncharacterized protein LOC125649620 n=1 Tax=Ostrea edulis TaxID=37623 RepID=UPI0024AFC0EB|nr:uncharacterized protein LOC125649620 [Ostrea edulis]
MGTVDDGKENDLLGQDNVKPAVNTDNTTNGPDDQSQVLAVDQNKQDGEQNNEKDGKKQERPKTGRSRAVDEYTVNFYYLQDADSARDVMRSHAPKYARILDEKRISDGEEHPYGEFIHSYNLSIQTSGALEARKVESDLYNLWLTKRPANEVHCWLEIRRRNMRGYDPSQSSITTIEGISFYGGSMLSPVKFSKHWDMKSSNKVVFENDKQLLSIESVVPTGLYYDVIEIPYSSMHDGIVVHLQKQSTALFVNVKSNPKIFNRKDIDSTRTDEKRNVCFQGISREEFGRCSSFCIELPGNILDDTQSKLPLGWQVVSRLKRLGFTVVYADVTVIPHNPTDFQSPFEDFDVEYAWMCLVSQGFKVTDHFNEENALLVRHSVNCLTPETLYRFAATANQQPFIHLAHIISTQVNDKKQTREETEEDLPPGYSMIRRMVLTPTKHVFFPKEPIVQNRIIRHYEEEYFIRIVFRDEDYERVSAIQPNALDSVIEAMKMFLLAGFQILDRNYEFLGCSNSQLREHGFWFFCPNDGISAQLIRNQSGDISRERCVASYVSRFGLCFSASRDTVDVGVNPGEMVEEEDIERNDYCFSDGIGKISPYLANEVANALQLNVVPSAFQIRYGGCKGVVSQDPNLSKASSILVIRQSMNKFTSNSKNLEILQVTNPGKLHLNRQVITLLSGLGVPDKVFLSLQEDMLFSLADMMLYDKEALKALSALTIDIKFKKLQKRGVVFIREPFFRSMLITIYKSKVRDLMRRARIQLPFENGRIMMGTLDETQTLEYGQVFVQYSCVPGQQQEDSIVLTGKVVATKNPCFHPGDLRKYEAVDVPALHHMFDCIVFPQKGHRPHPDEMSGSDLDGDMYFVCWDDQLCNVIENQKPMDFPKSQKMKLNHDVMVDDIIEFLGDYIKNDNLGVIANAHVVHADKENIFTEACKQLAKMHSDAVDFPKTGTPAKMTRDLRVDSYPDFMQKTDKPQYMSKKVLGKLFRQCRALEQAQTRRRDSQKIIRNLRIDEDFILFGWEKYEEDAVMSRNTYNDKLRQILTLYGIENETEAISGIIRRLRPNRGCLNNEKYEIGQVVKAKMSVVRKRTREQFFQEFGGESNIDLGNIGKEALLKASAWYQITYHPSPGNPEPLLSFPWVIADVLALLKGDELQKRTDAITKDVTEEDERFGDNLFDIGSSIVRRFFFTKSQRQLTLNNLKHVAKLVLSLLAPVKGATFIPVGTSIVGLMKTDEVTVDIYVDSRQKRKVLFDFIRSLLYNKSIIITERGPCPKYRVSLGDNLYFVRFSTDVNVLRRSVFLKTFIEENKEIVPVILFLLDWGRRTFVVSPTRSGHIFDEVTFAMVVSGCVLTMMDLPKDKVLHPQNIKMDAISAETMHVVDVDDIPSSKTKTLAKIVMQFFKDYRAILAEGVKKGLIQFIPDPSDRREKKNLLKHPLSQNNTTSLLNEMLCSYQQIAEKNSIDYFFEDVEIDEGHLVLNLPLDTWDSLLFAEAYIERQLSRATGADIKIRRTNFRETKGIILEAWGSSEQLWNVNKSLQDLGQKSSKVVSTFTRDRAFIEGAYVTFFEGSRSKNDILDFRHYSGQIQEDHKHRGPPHLPCLHGVSRNVDPSLQHFDDNDPDCQEFQRVFLEQVCVVRENCDVTYHGVLRLAITFGKVYLVDVDAGQMTIKDLQETLHRKHFIERKEFNLYLRGRGRGRGRGRRRGESYSNLRNNLPPRRSKISSSFIPCNCDPRKVEEFLEEMGFKKDGKEKKYHVSLGTGEADFGKPHTGLCVLDRDFRFIHFRLSDLKWLAGDIVRLKNDDNKNSLDVRCKLQSMRILDVESVRQMSDIKGLLDENFRMVEVYGNGLRVSPDFKDRVSFLREKQVNSYSYPDSSDEQGIWHNMKIDVATVKEHSGYNSIIGTFSDTVERTEVTMLPKFPDLSSSDDELKKYARKTWNLALYLGHRFE